ncbi:MAG: amidohydrolase family protein [Deltaproteobacteria bacterium]|nr:amidohydrolase family protein [Deltaproteobacteria bacterium]
MRFVDAHTHLEFFAFKRLPIEMARTKRDLLDMIESIEGNPVVAWGWSEDTIGESITRQDIDKFPFPILLIRIDAHMGVINKKAMEELKKTPSEKFDPKRGYVYEEVLWKMVSVLKPKEITGDLLKAQEEAISKGIIEVHDFVDFKIAETYFKLREDGNLKLRVVLMPYYRDYENVIRLFDNYGEDDLIKPGWVKIFVDGSISARTAYLREPYKDKHSRGILLKTEEELKSIIQELEGKGLKVALHTIGDAAIDVVLNAFEKANIRLKGHRIEHSEMIDHKQAKRVKEMNLILCIQPNFNVTFMETYIKALGENRAKRMNPLKMLDEIGADMIFGSDMMPFDPKIGLEYASQILGGEKALHYYGGWKRKVSLP